MGSFRVSGSVTEFVSALHPVRRAAPGASPVISCKTAIFCASSLFVRACALRFTGIHAVELLEILRSRGSARSIKSLSLPALKFWSRALTAPNLLPSMASSSPPKSSSFPAEHRELPRHGFQRLQIIFAEVGNGLEVGRLFAGEPDHFHVAPGTPPPAAGTNAPGAGIRKGKLEQHRRI